MIVKNETANLARCLGSLAGVISCWIIGDTGSTDGTPEFINDFFYAKGIPGELHRFSFENFEQARNSALDHALKSSLEYDYLLLVDADMELQVEDATFRQRLSADAYQVVQRSGITYWNTRLLRRGSGSRYRGVTHEYIDVPSGDAQKLAEISFIDHASGSNRVDKFERDIRLLLDGLQQEPTNSRYLFYLAQSYRDAGRLAEAADTYAQRAASGGWDEERWYARLEEAKCLQRMGNAAGFIETCLAAFDLRPHRAEPLYELAKHYRLRSNNNSAHLFAEKGLAIGWPEHDVLFIDEYAYRFGLKEEISIAANYATDRKAWERGRAICDELATAREAPERVRGLARSNNRWYCEPASRSMPSFKTTPLAYEAPEGHVVRSVSIAMAGDQIRLLVSSSRSSDDGSPGIGSYQNHLLTLSDRLEPVGTPMALVTHAEGSQAADSLEGMACHSLFSWQASLWCLATADDPGVADLKDTVLVAIDDASERLKPYRVLSTTSASETAAWMPIVTGTTLGFLTSLDPVRIVDDQGNPRYTASSPVAIEAFGGRAPLAFCNGGWLGLVAEIDANDPSQTAERRFYRFVWLDSLFVARSLSWRFYLEDNGTGVADGLLVFPERGEIVISFASAAGEVFLATMSLKDVQHTLRLVDESSPRLSPPYGDAAPDTRLLPNLEAAMEPFWLHPSGATMDQSQVRVAASAWTPPVPMAGTELMVSRLRERLGSDLDDINLQVNGFDPAQLDRRPLVVWFHHDVNQNAVQWCSDRGLVDKVARCVFVSEWQKARYLRAFDLPSSICVVVRNATEVPAQDRPWRPGSPWRCAYASTPFRGLSVLLRAWEILQPDNAELHIWSSMRLYRQDDKDRDYQHLYDRAAHLPGVTYHGLSPNAELRAAMREMHFLTYPNTFEETSCLAVIEAMAAGCRVIVPEYGALPETTAGYARTYAWTDREDEHARRFASVLADELAAPWSGDAAMSVRQQQHTRDVHDWGHCQDEWKRLIESLTRGSSGDAAPDVLDRYCRFYGRGRDLFGEILAGLLQRLEAPGDVAPTLLCDIMNREKSDKGNGWHNYTQLYSLLFEEQRMGFGRLVEIGIGTNFPDVASSMGPDGVPGASLRGWRRYMPNTKVIGADVDRRILFSEPGIETYFVDQLDDAAIAAFWGNISSPDIDIIVDDGLHSFEANKKTLLESWRHLNESGFYIIEGINVNEDNLRAFDGLFREIGVDGCVIRLPIAKNPYDNCVAVLKKSARRDEWRPVGDPS